MATNRWYSRSWCLAVLALLVLSLDPASLFAQEVQDGKWKVPPGVFRNIFVNASGAAQHVMITICVTSGTDVQLELEQNVLLGKISAPECITARGFVADTKVARIGNASGSNASGTYVVTLVPF